MKEGAKEGRVGRKWAEEGTEGGADEGYLGTGQSQRRLPCPITATEIHKSSWLLHKAYIMFLAASEIYNNEPRTHAEDKPKEWPRKLV